MEYIKQSLWAVLLILTSIGLLSCQQEKDLSINNEGNNFETNIPDDFNYNTTKSVEISLKLMSSGKTPIATIRIEVYGDTLSGEHKRLMVGATDEQGYFVSELTVPSYYNNLILVTNFPGIANNIVLPIHNNRIEYTIDGSEPNIFDTYEYVDAEYNARKSNARTLANYNYLGSWNSAGVPNYLESQRDQISAELLEKINFSLPENKPVPQYHPDFLADEVQTNIDIVQTADVWVTFIHEGAGWRNTLCFYSYPTDTPPQSVDDIQELTVIFPNVSFNGSGGGLTTGDKVNIGRFSPGTTVGFALVAQGWNSSTSDVGQGEYTHYSNSEFNNETNPEIREHNVLLYDEEEELVLLGFEDVRRDNIPFTCDNDFNDALFYVTSNPVTAIDKSQYLPIDVPVDSDNDGISDIYDDYPLDNARAFDNFVPAQNSWGSLAYEDLWPGKGDYDFNDLVVNYKYNLVTNTNNEVVEMFSDFLVQAAGASYQNGFGYVLEINPGLIREVSGYAHMNDYISLNSNGTEAGQTQTVIIPFDNTLAVVDRPSGYFVNTQLSAPYVESDTVNINIAFNAPVSRESLGKIPFNPFVISNMERGKEVHLPDHLPTDKADFSVFGTYHDTSSPSLNRYYKSSQNLPWALHFLEEFKYPIEKKSIEQVYNNYFNWAQSGGLNAMDWYSNDNYNLEWIYNR